MALEPYFEVRERRWFWLLCDRKGRVISRAKEGFFFKGDAQVSAKIAMLKFV